MMTTRQARHITAIAAVLLFAASALSADVRGKLEGFVLDAEKNPIPKVKVSIISLKSSVKHFSVSTNEKGKFTQIGIWPGYYQVNLKKEGYQPLSTEVKVDIAESTKLQLTLKKVEKAVEQTLSQADKFFVRGNKLYAEQKYDQAAAAFENAVKQNAENWGYYFNLGLAYKKMKNPEKGLAAFRKAAALNPASYSCNKEMGEVLAQSEKYEEALPFYKKAMDKGSGDPDIFYNYGVVLINLGRSDEAIKAFEKTVEIKEDYAEAFFQLGTLYVGKNRVEDAIRSFERFLSLAPDHAKAPLAKQLLDYLKK